MVQALTGSHAEDSQSLLMLVPARRYTHQDAVETDGRLLIDAGRAITEPAALPHLSERLHSQVPSEHWIESFISQLSLEVAQKALRVLVLELNLAWAGNLLDGDGGRASYNCFIGALHTPDYNAYLRRKYPVLFRLLDTYITNACRAALALVRRYEDDHTCLRERLDMPDDPTIAELAFLGDPHKFGQRTAILTHANGRRLAYKPRSGALDRLYAHIIDVANTHLAHPLKTAPILDRGDYHWQAHIESNDTTAPGSLPDSYYYQLGAWLGIAHYTGVRDLHFENVINGQHGPVVIDLECALTPLLKLSTPLPQATSSPHLSPYRVTDVGILPHIVGGQPGRDGINWGVVGYTPNQRLPIDIHTLRDDGTAHARLELTSGVAFRTPGAAASESGRYDSERLPLSVEALIATGFLDARQGIIAELGAIESAIRNSAAKVRVIAKPTQVYADAIRAAAFPRYLQSMRAYRARLRDGLDRYFEQLPAALTEYELECLADGDIPIFTATIDSGTARGAHRGIAAEIPLSSGLDQLEARLATLEDSEDVERQIRLIRQAVAVHRRSFNSVQPMRGLGQFDLLTGLRSSEAIRLASRRTVANSWRARGFTWMNALVAENEQWRLQESSLDLYSGATGTGLALAAAHYVEGIDIQEERLDALVEAVANEVAHGRDRRAIGLFNGLAGMLYFLACMARYDQRHSKVVKSAVHAGLEQLEASVQEDSRYDIISGSAGVLVLADRLLRARMAAPSLARAAIERCVSTLAGAAEPLHPGAIVWRNTDDDWLGGLSHGVAGIGWALSHARGTVADKLARGAWLSQLTLRRSGMEWEDRRKSAGGAGRPFNAWCHGADGIVLAALDYRTSTDSLRSKHFGEWVYSDPVDDPSLCHGRAGRLALLSHIRDSVKLGKSLAVDQAVLSTAISEMRRQVVQDLERSFRGKDDRFALDDGLMVGSAGALISLLIERHGPRTANPLTVSLPR